MNLIKTKEKKKIKSGKEVLLSFVRHLLIAEVK